MTVQSATALEPVADADPLVSIVMLSYNYRHYLEATIASALSQTYTNTELVIVDDGSSDDSLAYLLERERLDPQKIRVFQHPNGVNKGIYESSQLAFAQTRGELVAFLETDDLWLPENLEKKVAALVTHPDARYAFSRYTPFGERRGPVLYWQIYEWGNHLYLARQPVASLFHYFLIRNPAATFSNILVYRDDLVNVPGSPPKSDTYDWWVLAHLSSLGNAAYLPQHLVRWRIHTSSAAYAKVGFKELKKLQDLLQALYPSLEQFAVLTSPQQRNLDECKALHKFIMEEAWFKIVLLAIRRPFSSGRFLAHLILKNLLM